MRALDLVDLSQSMKNPPLKSEGGEGVFKKKKRITQK